MLQTGLSSVSSCSNEMVQHSAGCIVLYTLLAKNLTRKVLRSIMIEFVKQTAPHKPEFKHSASLPRNFSTRVGIESNDSEYGSCESKELSGTSTWHSAKSSLKERLSGFSDGAESGDKKDSARKLSSCPEKIERQKTMPAKNANLGDFLDASM